MLGKAIPGYATVAELHKATGVPEQTIRWHCRQGILAGHVSASGNLWLIPIAAAEAFRATYKPRRKP